MLCVSQNYQTELFVEERKKQKEGRRKNIIFHEVVRGAVRRGAL